MGAHRCVETDLFAVLNVRCAGVLLGRCIERWKHNRRKAPILRARHLLPRGVVDLTKVLDLLSAATAAGVAGLALARATRWAVTPTHACAACGGTATRIVAFVADTFRGLRAFKSWRAHRAKS